ncbi:hypothetical protein [Nonomuraea sp. KM90]
MAVARGPQVEPMDALGAESRFRAGVRARELGLIQRVVHVK